MANTVNLQISTLSSAVKAERSSALSGNRTETVKVCMARNESESFQIALRAGEGITGLLLEHTLLPDGLTCEVFREHFIKTGAKSYPDPLEPMSGTFDVPADDTVILLVRFTASEKCAGGIFTCAFSVCDGAGNVLETVRAEVKVWHFALPEHPSCVTAVGLSGDSLAAFNGVEGDEAKAELYRSAYETLLSYRVSAYSLPYDILDGRADAYMSDPRVTSFCIPYAQDDETIRAYYRKLSANPEWMKKAYFYPLDEPTQPEALEKLAAIAERLGRLFPGYRLCTPFFVDIDVDENTDEIAFMTGKTNVWCPKSFLYHTDKLYNEKQKEKYPSFAARMAERQKMGDDVWWYVCWEPGYPYCNMYVDEAALHHRLLFWQQKSCRVGGFLYWCSDFWSQTKDPWEDIATVKDLSPTVFGDGSLIYNGSKVGLYGACGSLRLDAIRDGIEDYDLLSMAEREFGEDWVAEQIAKVSPDIVTYTEDAAQFLTVREAIGDALDGKLKNRK